MSILSVFLIACDSSVPSNVIEGILEVPENRQNPDSRTLKLAYKVLKSKKAGSEKDPIVYLQGGPGAPTLIMEGFWKNHPLRNDRDIVLMDQRGTGASEANCTNLGEAIFNIASQDLDNAGEIKALKAVLTQCKKAMKQNGVDLAGYTSKENAADFEELRKTLGYKKWNLFGTSYGSRLGLTIMRDFPNGVRSAVFNGVLTPETNLINDQSQNFEHTLFTIIERCKKDENCNNRYPNLKMRLLSVLDKLKSDPLQIDYDGKSFVFNPQDFLLILYLSLYDRHSLSNIPLLIEAVEKEEKGLLVNALKGIKELYTLINWPTNFSVMGYEELPFYNDVAMAESLKQSELSVDLSISSALGMELLKGWHSFRASEIENQIVVSEIPTLLVSGDLDHVTPVSNATKALKYLKNGHGLIFPNESHNFFNRCFFQITEDFLNDPSHIPDSECSTLKNPIEWNLLNPSQKEINK